MTSKVVQKSSAVKAMFLMLSAVSASSVDRMLGETYRRTMRWIQTKAENTLGKASTFCIWKLRSWALWIDITAFNHLSTWKEIQYLTCNTNCVDIWLTVTVFSVELLGVPEQSQCATLLHRERKQSIKVESQCWALLFNPILILPSPPTCSRSL